MFLIMEVKGWVFYWSSLSKDDLEEQLLLSCPEDYFVVNLLVDLSLFYLKVEVS